MGLPFDQHDAAPRSVSSREDVLPPPYQAPVGEGMQTEGEGKEELKGEVVESEGDGKGGFRRFR